jgi:hypothetical protein
MPQNRSVPVSRDEIRVLMTKMFGDAPLTVQAYLPVVDMALGMAEGGPDNWQDPDSDHVTEVAANLRFAASEITRVADELEASREAS